MYLFKNVLNTLLTSSGLPFSVTAFFYNKFGILCHNVSALHKLTFDIIIAISSTWERHTITATQYVCQLLHSTFLPFFRRVHTESAKHWLEYLESEPVQVLVCLTHADRLYVEYLGEDGTHRPTDIVRKEIKIQLDVSTVIKKWQSCVSHLK